MKKLWDCSILPYICKMTEDLCELLRIRTTWHVCYCQKWPTFSYKTSFHASSTWFGKPGSTADHGTMYLVCMTGLTGGLQEDNRLSLQDLLVEAWSLGARWRDPHGQTNRAILLISNRLLSDVRPEGRWGSVVCPETLSSEILYKIMSFPHVREMWSQRAVISWKTTNQCRVLFWSVIQKNRISRSQCFLKAEHSGSVASGSGTSNAASPHPHPLLFSVSKTCAGKHTL